jgi:ADP-ribosylation factor GTPase-activating protein 2/3
VVAADGLDFEEAERKAREEAERIEKLGYDPDAEAAEAATAAKSKAPEASAIVSPTPVSPARGGFGSTAKPERSGQDMERLGMGVQRLGFGQVGAAKKPAQHKMIARDTRARSSVSRRVSRVTSSSVAPLSIPRRPPKRSRG